MAATYSLEQAMALLNMSRNRLARWIQKLGIIPTDHPHERRVKLLSSDDVQAIREAADTAQTLLVRAITPPSAISPVESTHRPSQPYIAPRPARVAVQVDGRPPPLPDGWVTLDSLIKRYKLHRLSVERDVRHNKVEVTRGEWYKPPNTPTTALSPEQQAAFLAKYGLDP